ncbi:MAG: aminopeptidase [Thermodesulfobacteriota bacterium]
MDKSVFKESELENYADVMIWGIKKARKNELLKNSFIEIKYDYDAVYLAEKIYEKLILLGYNPLLKSLKTPIAEKAFFEKGDTAQLEAVEPGYEKYLSEISASITLLAPSSLEHLKSVDSSKISHFSKSRKNLRQILTKREESGDYSWSLCIYPTSALAQAAGMSTESYADKISKACFLNKENPVEIWKELSNKIEVLKKKLLNLDIDFFHIESKNTDLIIKNGENRKWLGISGRNIPSYELFISPDWRFTSGKYFADQPSYRSGNIIKNISLEFKDGEVIYADADQGKDYLIKTLETDPGAKRLGEFSMTDKNFSSIDSFMANTLYDENFGGDNGNVHIALGNSYSNSYSEDIKNFNSEMKKNLGFNDSAIHWDIVNTEEKTVTAVLKSGKEKTIYSNGSFQV